MQAKITLIGLHNYSDGSIWSGVELPEGMDSEVLINEILKQCGEFPVLYSDANFMQAQITFFFKKWKHNFTKWWNAFNSEYEPLFNVDVKTTFTEEGENSEDSSKSGNTSAIQNNSAGTITNGSNSSSGNSAGSTQQLNDHFKAAYDASTFQPTERDSLSNSSSANSSNSETTSLSTSELGSMSNSATNSESMTAESSHSIEREEWKRGNYGTTMSQELLLAEYNAWKFNVYSQIADIFSGELCICIYG